MILRYHYSNGSLPPPYHFEYSISVEEDGSGELAYSPDYPADGVPLWIEQFKVSPFALAELSETLERCRACRPQWKLSPAGFTGGSAAWLELDWDGKHASIPPHLSEKDAASIQPVFEAIRGFVPQEIWQLIESRKP